jgi:putative salt-induced outer membrane protein YdiY
MMRSILGAVLMLSLASVVGAQDAPPAPPPTWTGAIGAGLALTSGNSDTSSVNVSFKAVRDPKTNTVFAAEGLYLRGSKDGAATADNALFNTRLERKLGAKAFGFTQLQYLRDSFKAIEYFLAPTVGLGYRFYDGPKGTFSADASVGASWEKNRDRAVKTNAIVAFGEKFTRVLSKTATFTHTFAGNVVASDWADSLYTFSVGIAASMTARTQLKLEVLDTFKNKPPAPDIKKNDVSTVVAVVYKF